MNCKHNPIYVEKEYNLGAEFEDIINYDTDDLLTEHIELISNIYTLLAGICSVR
jgi:hypothetical protein